MQVLLGPRQVGKTTAVQQIAKSWKGPVVYASTDLLFPPDQDWIKAQWQKARAFQDKPTLLILDEIQKVPGWSSVVKALFDEERQRPSRLRIVLIGSANWSMGQGQGDILAGRFEIIRAFHWTYQECAQVFAWDLQTYLKFGGFPVAAQFIRDPERWKQFLLNSIIEPMLSKDILPLKLFPKPALFREAFALAMGYPAQMIPINKLLGKLQGGGNTVTLKSYFDLMESGYVVRLLDKYSMRTLSRNCSAPKFVPLCPALIHAFASATQVDQDPEWFGRAFENAIGALLCQYFSEVSYWRKGSAEVDYAVVFEGRLIALEIKSGRKKSSKGLSEFKVLFPKAESISMDRELGEKFLLADDPREFLLNLLAGQRIVS